MDFSSGEFWKRRKSWFPVTIPFGPQTANSTLKGRSITGCWLLSVMLKWITINWRTDGFYGEAAVTWVHLLTQLLNEASFLHSAKFRHQSGVNYCLSRLTLCDWYARLTWLLIKVAGKAITTSDILGMLCLLSSVFHGIRLQSSHRQEWSLHKHKLDCVAYMFHHP